MYVKLDDYSNKYMNVYSGKGRIIIDLIHPRLVPFALYSENPLNILSVSPTTQSLITNNYPVTSTIASLSGDVVATGSVSVSDSYIGSNYTTTMYTKEISVKKLIFSVKNGFGRIYVVDEFNKPSLRLTDANDGFKQWNTPSIRYSRNLIAGAKTFCVLFPIFTQLNVAITELITAIIIPKNELTTRRALSFQHDLKNYSNRETVTAALMAFAFPVLQEIKYFSSESYNINPGWKYYRFLTKAKTFAEFFKMVTGIKGGKIISRLIQLSKITINRHLSVGANYLLGNLAQDSADISKIDPEILVTANKELAAGKSIDSIMELFPDQANVMKSRSFNIRNKIEYAFVNNSYSFTGNQLNYGSWEQVWPVPFETIESYSVDFLEFFMSVKDYVPLDDWFQPIQIPDRMYALGAVSDETIQKTGEWLHNQSLSTRRKIVQTLNDQYLLDLVHQLRSYDSADKVPDRVKYLYPNGIELPKRWKTLQELHDLVVKDYNRIKSAEKYKEVKYNEAFLSKLDGLDFGNGLTSELPKDTVRILEYGQILSHCVGSYADRCANSNDTIILSINENGQPKYTLELHRTDEYVAFFNNQKPVAYFDPNVETDIAVEKGCKYDVNQFKGLRNAIPKIDEVKDIVAILKKTNIIRNVYEPQIDTHPRFNYGTMPDPIHYRMNQVIQNIGGN